jgi:hypothetical protein
VDAVGAGVIEQGGDGLGCAVGDGCPDGGLVLVDAVEDLDAECGVQGLADGVGGVEH